MSSPKLTEDCDIRSLPIGPTEAFILSRIDGHTALEELAISTGLPESTVRDALELLERLGAIWFPGTESEPRGLRQRPQGSRSNRGATGESERPPAASTAPISSAAPPAKRPSNPVGQHQPTPDLEQITALPSYDHSLLDEPGDLPRETKAEILQLMASLEDCDHYQLLGVARDAEKADIKAAYFAKVNRFHTDRHFGKDLGTFRSRLEKIFAALTKAHDTLTRKKLRAEYDEYLASRDATEGARGSLPPPRGETETDRGAVGADIPRSAPVPAAPESHHPVTSIPPTSRVNPHTARSLLARKLGNNSRRASSSPPAQPAMNGGGGAALDNLKARMRAREQQAAADQKLHYVQMSEQAEREGQWGSALNALRLAMSVAPDDQELAVRLEATQLRADQALADKFVEQGTYEERDGHWGRAARSFERAARGKKSAEYYSRASACQQRAGNDKRRAVELARQSVQLAPGKARYHLVLARAYLEAGMRTSAAGEVRRALESEPKNSEALELQKELKSA